MPLSLLEASSKLCLNVVEKNHDALCCLFEGKYRFLAPNTRMVVVSLRFAMTAVFAEHS